MTSEGGRRASLGNRLPLASLGAPRAAMRVLFSSRVRPATYGSGVRMHAFLRALGGSGDEVVALGEAPPQVTRVRPADSEQ